MKELTTILSSVVSAIAAVAGYDLFLRADETKIAEELAIVKITVSNNERTMERMRRIVDEWDDLKISLIREGVDISALEGSINDYISTYLEENSDNFSGPPGEQGVAGKDASQFIVFPSDGVSTRRIDFDGNSLVRNAKNAFEVPQSGNLDRCKIDDTRYKVVYPDFFRGMATGDICASNVGIADIQDSAIVKIGNIEMSITYAGDDVEDIEIGAQYSGYQHPARFQFNGGTVDEPFEIIATPGDTVYIKDPSNLAVELKFEHIKRNEDGLMFNFHANRVVLE